MLAYLLSSQISFCMKTSRCGGKVSGNPEGGPTCQAISLKENLKGLLNPDGIEVLDFEGNW